MKFIKIVGIYNVLVASFSVMLLAGFFLTTSVVIADVASGTCAMAHCSPSLSDQIPEGVVNGPVAQAWRYTGASAGLGLGAVVGSNFTAVVLNNSNPALIVFNADGTERWNSGSLLGNSVKGTALVDSSDNIYVASSSRVIKFSPAGGVLWNVANPAASTPFSLNVTSEGNLIGYGQAGPVWLMSQSNGAVLSTLNLTGKVGKKSGTYITVNTTAVSGTRAYIATQFSGNSAYGRLYALETSGGILKEAWNFNFGGVTGGSPTVSGNRIYFDGRRVNATDSTTGLFQFAVQDNGATAQKLWSVDIKNLSSGGTDIQVSPALDPRGGVWAFALHGSKLLRLDEFTGGLLQEINTSTLLGVSNGHYVPSSVMNISLNQGSPIMYVGAMPDHGFSGSNKITAIDLLNNSLFWQFSIASPTYSQFPIILPGTLNIKPVLVVPTNSGGVYGISSVN